jgi:hypothetical protein
MNIKLNFLIPLFFLSVSFNSMLSQCKKHETDELKKLNNTQLIQLKFDSLLNNNKLELFDAKLISPDQLHLTKNEIYRLSSQKNLFSNLNLRSSETMLKSIDTNLVDNQIHYNKSGSMKIERFDNVTFNYNGSRLSKCIKVSELFKLKNFENNLVWDFENEIYLLWENENSNNYYSIIFSQYEINDLINFSISVLTHDHLAYDQYSDALNSTKLDNFNCTNCISVNANSFTKSLNIKISTSKELVNPSICVYNSIGQLMKVQLFKENYHSGQNDFLLNLPELPTGLYFIEIFSQGFQAKTKFTFL